MILKCNYEDVISMAVLAVNNSIPVGMGFLHYEKKDYDDKKIRETYPSNSKEINIDYFYGRMTKFYAIKVNDSEWKFLDNLDTEYESWAKVFSSYELLLNATKK